MASSCRETVLRVGVALPTAGEKEGLSNDER